MKRKNFLMVTLITLFFMISGIAEGSWAYFSFDELVNKSDVILVGYIKGPIEVIELPNGLPATKWNVLVHYYLKGNIKSKELAVLTPGAKNVSKGSSIDYNLDDWGQLVMLFLREKNSVFEPITPRGVIALNSNRYARNVLDPPTGDTLLKQFSINDPKISKPEKGQLENLVRKMPVVPPGQPPNTDNNMKGEDKTTLIYWGAGALIIVFIASMFFKKLRN